MTFHPVLDHEELARALDAAPIEELVEALVRRSRRAAQLGEAAYHEACATLDRAHQDDLLRRVATSARVCRNISEAVHALAPMSAQDREAAAHARMAQNIDRLAAIVQTAAREARLGHA